MNRTAEARRSRLHRPDGAAFAAALVEFNHLRLGEETRAALSTDLGVRTTPTFCRTRSEILTEERPADSDAPPSLGEPPFFQHQAPMRITVTIPHERDLGCGSVALESVTAVADVDLSNEANPVSWISVETDGEPLTAWEVEDLCAPLSALEDRVIEEAEGLRATPAKTTAESAERSVA
jgi:hypothetical protein